MRLRLTKELELNHAFILARLSIVPTVTVHLNLCMNAKNMANAPLVLSKMVSNAVNLAAIISLIKSKKQNKIHGPKGVLFWQ